MIKESIVKMGKTGGSKGYVFPEIPEKKLNGAIKAIIPNEPPEYIVGILDTTVFGSGKEGIVFLGDSLTVKDMLEKPVTIKFEDILDVVYEETVVVDEKDRQKSKYSLTISTKNQEFELAHRFLGTIHASVLQELLNEIVALGNDSQEEVRFEKENQQKPLEMMDEVVKIAYIKILCNYVFGKKETIDSKEYAEIISFIVKVGIKPEDRILLRGYMLSESEHEDMEELLEILSDKTTEVEFSVIQKSLMKDLLILYKTSNVLSDWEEDRLLLAIAGELDLGMEEVQLIVEVIQHDEDIITKRLNDKQITKSFKDISAKAAAVGVPMAALYFSGAAGVSAIGMTTGLATLGMGGILGFSSMFTGVGALALIGVGTYQGVKKLAGMKDLENNKQREKLLQEIIKNSQKTLNIIIEDVKIISEMLIAELKKGTDAESKIEKLAGIIGMLSQGAETITQKINVAEIENMLTKIPKKLDSGKINELTSASTLFETRKFIFQCYSGEDYSINPIIDLDEIQELYGLLEQIGYFNLKEASIATVKSGTKNLVQGLLGK